MVTNSEAFERECDDVKAAQQSEAAIPEHLLFTTEPMIRYREIPRDVAEEQHWEDRRSEQEAIDQADEWDRIEARTGVSDAADHDDRGSLFPESARPEDFGSWHKREAS